MTAEAGAPATGTTPDQMTTPPAAPEVAKDWKSEHDKILANSRKWEDRAKANANAAKELEALRAQTMTDTERAVADAAKAARETALAEVATERVADAIRAAAAGRTVDIDALLEGVDPSRFVKDGQVDRDAVKAWIDRIAPAAAPADPQVPQVYDLLGQGARGGTNVGNSNPLLADIQNMLGISH